MELKSTITMNSTTKEIKSLLDKGFTIAQVARKLDINRSTVNYHINKHGLKYQRQHGGGRKPKISEDDFLLLTILLNKGWSARRIAEKMNMSPITVRKIARRNGIKCKSSEGINKEDIKKQLVDGLNLEEIAQKFDKSVSTIRGLLFKYNISKKDFSVSNRPLKREIIECLDSGMTVVEIANYFGKSKSSMYKKINRMGINLKKHNEVSNQRIKEYLDLGMSVYEIANKVGMSPQGVYYRIKRWKLKLSDSLTIN